MKRFNLLFDPWIPVKTSQTGNRGPIKAYEIVQHDIIALDVPRADFNAALMQFLIGLVQTVLAPKNPKEWRTFYNQPPSEDELKRKFEGIKDAFYLDGEGFRFMQDPLAMRLKEESRPIEEMIFGAPGESGKEKNQDYFVKQKDITGLCYSCTASALLAANIFAEDGGSGYFQSMRGNGFVSCLVQVDEYKSKKSLWKNIWLNIIENNIGHGINKDDIFCWIKDLPDKLCVDKSEKIKIEISNLKAKRRTIKSENIDIKLRQLKKDLVQIQKEIDELSGFKIVFPEKKSLKVYWAWMRRFFLDTNNIIQGQCSICQRNDTLVHKFYKVGKGYKYPKEEWQNMHPFSPSGRYQRAQYDKNTLKYKDKMLAIEMTQNGLPYTYWQDFIIQTENRTPAEVVNRYLKEKLSDDQLIIWSFGYAMDSNSPKGWYESKTPLYLLENQEQRKDIEAELGRYILASSKIANSKTGYLSVSMRMAWFGYDYWEEQKKGERKRRDPLYNYAAKSLYNQPIEIAKCFLNNTENKFYQLLKTLYDNVEHLTDDKKNEFRSDWYKHIKHEAEELFNRWAFKSGIQTNPRRIAEAHNQLLQNLNSKALKQDTLGLR